MKKILLITILIIAGCETYPIDEGLHHRLQHQWMEEDIERAREDVDEIQHQRDWERIERGW